MKSNLDNLEESIIDDLWNVNGNRILGGNHEFPHPQQTSTQRLFMSRWQIDQKSSNIKTRNDSARSVVIYVQMFTKKGRVAMGDG